MTHVYRFRSHWRLPAGADEVYRTLREAGDYPRWWPQVLSTEQLDDESGRLRCRSFLPYTLSFVATRQIEDPEARVLRAGLSGDLNGFSQWQITPDTDATSAVFTEEVTLGSPLLRTVSTVLRPLMIANHAAMMRAGERGLRTQLAGGPAQYW